MCSSVNYVLSMTITGILPSGQQILWSPNQQCFNRIAGLQYSTTATAICFKYFRPSSAEIVQRGTIASHWYGEAFLSYLSLIPTEKITDHPLSATDRPQPKETMQFCMISGLIPRMDLHQYCVKMCCNYSSWSHKDWGAIQTCTHFHCNGRSSVIFQPP